MEFAFPRQARGDDVLGEIAAHIIGGAVNLRWVFAGEGTAPMSPSTTVSIDNNLTAGHPHIALGTADVKRTESFRVARPVNHQVLVYIESLPDIAALAHNRLDHIFYKIAFDFFEWQFTDFVLRGKHGTNNPRTAIVADCDLGFAIRSQVVNHAGLANFRHLFGQLVGHGNGERHQFRGLVARETEHHTLIARTRILTRGPGGDVRRLGIDCNEDTGSGCVHSNHSIRVADIP